MGIRKELFSILYLIKQICTENGDYCIKCPFKNDKGCEMKRITGTYPISWKELKEES